NLYLLVSKTQKKGPQDITKSLLTIKISHLNKMYNIEMKKQFLATVLLVFMSACNSTGYTPQLVPIQSPIPSSTPNIITSTPIILSPLLLTASPNVTVISQITPTTTETPPPTSSITPVSPTLTFTPSLIQSVSVEILGCNTGVDILHGMGEVTNAYVKVKNTGTVDLPDSCALLRAIDEGREHPDKKVCINTLPVNNQVTLKLTVDSTYKTDTIIQIDVTTNDVILLRVDRQSCRDIDHLGGVPADIGIVKPIE
ncbi:MAG TPA: hypothetical protein PLL95_14965, partial [Anaerolineales bacterium]|nr:hypothetical protein [Anaerolineales bacterium]